MPRKIDKNDLAFQNLSELRSTDISSDTDMIAKKLAELFSLQEVDYRHSGLSQEQQDEQLELQSKVSEIEHWFNLQLKEREEEKFKIQGIIDVAQTMRIYPDSLGSKSEVFSDIQEQIDELPKLANELVLISQAHHKDSDDQEVSSSLLRLFHKYGIEYKARDFDLMYKPVTREAGIKFFLSKQALLVNSRKRQEVTQSVYQSISELEKVLKERIISITVELRKKIQARVDDITDQLQGDHYQDAVKSLIQLSSVITDKLSGYHQLTIPDEFFSFYDDVKVLLVKTQQQLEDQQYEKLSSLDDTSDLVSSVVSQMLELLQSTDLITQRPREAIISFLGKLESKYQIKHEVSAEIRQQCEQKRLLLFMVHHPDELKKNLYEMYQNLDLPRNEKKKFLRTAVHLVEELTETQTDAFLSGYDEVWKSFQTVEQISLSNREIEQLFFKNGYEISSSGRVDFMQSLIRARDAHNEIVQMLSTRLDYEKKTPAQLGKELFKAYCKGRYLNLDDVPYGEVLLDLTLPITSIRFICKDIRDYKFASNEMDSATYKDKTKNKDTKSLSGGTSFIMDQAFLFPGGSLQHLPLTVINGTSTEDYQKKVVVHEDAHQAIISRKTELLTEVSAVNRRRKSLARDFNFDTPQLESYAESEIVTKWRDAIRSQLDPAVDTLRDEIQAYLTDGRSVEKTLSILTKSNPEALYDYVCGTYFRIAGVEMINQEFASNDEKRLELIEVFKADVLKARKKYYDFLHSYMRRVAHLVEAFSNSGGEDTAQQKVALLVRHATPEEFVDITKYLHRREKYQRKAAQELVEQTPDFQLESFLKLPLTEQVIELPDEKLDKLLVDAEEELSKYLFVMQDIFKVTPDYLQQAVGRLPSTTDILVLTKETVREIFTAYIALDNEVEKQFYWSKDDVAKHTEFTKKWIEIRNRLAEPAYLINGKNAVEGIREKIDRIVKPKQSVVRKALLGTSS